MGKFEVAFYTGLFGNVSYLLLFLRCLYNNPLSDIFDVVSRSLYVFDWWMGWLGLVVVFLAFSVFIIAFCSRKETWLWILLSTVILGYGGIFLLLSVMFYS